MSCVELDLPGFHFGTLTGEARTAVEAHLPGCAKCLQAYLTLKRELETVGENGPSPSLGFRTRLRAAVAQKLAPKPLRWWEPVLAFGSALGVVAAAMVSTWVATL